MSASEIADNKWEVEVTKPKLTAPGSIAMMGLMGGFGAFFVYILVFSIIGMFSEKKCIMVDGKELCGELADKMYEATHSSEKEKKAAPAEE